MKYVARGGSAYTVYWQGQVIGILLRNGGVWRGRTTDNTTVQAPTRDACASAMLRATPGYTE